MVPKVIAISPAKSMSVIGVPLLPSRRSRPSGDARRRLVAGSLSTDGVSRNASLLAPPRFGMNSGIVRQATSQIAVTMTSAAIPAENRSLRVPSSCPTAAKFIPPPM